MHPTRESLDGDATLSVVGEADAEFPVEGGLIVAVRGGEHLGHVAQGCNESTNLGLREAVGCFSAELEVEGSPLSFVFVDPLGHAGEFASSIDEGAVVVESFVALADLFAVIGGLTSGEGLVADLASRPEGRNRHVLVMEPEFARLLRVSARSATLSALLRDAWDGADLAILTRKQPLRATNASVAILGHVTGEELRRRLDQTEIANGLANRFLFVWVDRSKRLPNGGRVPLDEIEALGVRVRDSIERARQLGSLSRSEDAELRWSEIYNGLDDDVEGVVGSLTARAEAQMLRLSVVYALLDGSSVIDVAHLDAAEAVWQHCEATINRVFARKEPDWVLPRLLAGLREAGPAGLDGSAQRDLFHRHLPGVRLATARAELHARGLAYTVAIDTGGRPRIVTTLVGSGAMGPAAVSSLWSLPRSPVRSLEADRDRVELLGSDNRTVSEAKDD